MRLPWRKKSQKDLSRREIIARRRLSEVSESTPHDTGSFRRSRTLSSVRPVSESSERQVAWELRTKRRKLLSWLAGSVMAVALLLFLLSQLAATVKVVGPGGSDSRFGQYAAALDQYFAARPLERLRFMVHQPSLQAFFGEKAPEVQSVRLVSGGELGSALMQVSFRQPTVQWVSGEKKFFVDDLGVTFEKNYFKEPAISVEDKTGIPPELGQEVVNRRFLSFLGQAVSLLRQDGATVSGIILPQDTIRQVEFSIQDKPYRIKMTVDRGVEAQVKEAAHAMKYIDQRSMRPSYIDVRVDQRVFYR